nr:MAG: hypothetical protein [Chemarfal virus 215]
MASPSLRLQDCSLSLKIQESCTSCFPHGEPITPIINGGNLILENVPLRQLSISNTMTTSAELLDISLKNQAQKSLSVEESARNKLSLAKTNINVALEGRGVVPSWLKTGSSTLGHSMPPLERTLEKAVLTKITLLARWLEMDLCLLDQEVLIQWVNMLVFIDEMPYCRQCMTPMMEWDHDEGDYWDCENKCNPRKWMYCIVEKNI